MAVALLHGLGNDRSQLPALLGSTIPASQTVVAPDVRAHGASPLLGEPRDFRLDALAAELAEQIREGLAGDTSPIILIGVSMGAALALRIVLDATLPVERAVFIRPAFTSESLPRNLRAFPVIGELLAELGPARGEEVFRSSELFRGIREQSPAGAAAVLAQFRTPDAAARAIRLVEVPRNVAYRDPSELAAVTVPAAVVSAQRDPVHPEAIAHEWHGALPEARLFTIPPRDDGARAQAAECRRAVASWLGWARG
ncbi:alpha/beta fold hydrolase [Compostimonas suwonensis]|uniref:Alpha/beta hydrolase family protein n=1 Tax=Compostimonas suwonensis TaxID=1048394 RepID=A0A2M9BCR2_9MICO|nr:alpha/beta fold hydrolase [Compostimonas suwonensis]PJJ55748.1 alpha/beta hydrolase family protein [Compostimonas suwonensis]